MPSVGSTEFSSDAATAVFADRILGDRVLVDAGEDELPPALVGSAEWQLALRVAASKRFSKSDLLPRFLLYICQQTLLGDAQRITEQRLGTRIFNRDPDYNPGDDNIVRSYARTLRRRLEEYFYDEGRNEPLRLVIPRGGYVPVFEPNGSAGAVSNGEAPAADPPASLAQAEIDVESDSAPAPGIAELPAAGTRRPWTMPAWFVFAAGLLLGAVVPGGLWMRHQAIEQQQAQSSAHLLWTQMTQPGREPIVVPADSGFGILQNLSGQLVGLAEYADGSFQFSPRLINAGISQENIDDLRQQRYTSISDLRIATALAQLPEYRQHPLQIRYARNVSAEDFKDSNMILLGSAHTNPWVSLFDQQLNFRLVYLPTINRSFVVNEKPTGDEQRQYANGDEQSANRTYGVIDFLPNRNGSGHVLIIQGLNMAATQAAADMLLDRNEIKPFLDKAARADGSLRPFELLVETRSIGATDPEAKVIASRFHP